MGFGQYHSVSMLQIISPSWWDLGNATYNVRNAQVSMKSLLLLHD